MGYGYLTIYKGETGGVYSIPEVFLPFEPSPITYECRLCGEIFSFQEELEVHRASQHTQSRPNLLLYGRGEFRTDIEITRRLCKGDISFENCTGIALNGLEFDNSDLAAKHVLENQTGVLAVLLKRKGMTVNSTLRFVLIDQHQLELIEDDFLDIFSRGNWGSEALARFSERVQKHGVSVRYAGGLGCYITGLIAKDKSLASVPNRELYREKFGESLQSIISHKTQLSGVVSCLIYFALNQFEAANRSIPTISSPPLKSAVNFMLTGKFTTLQSESNPDVMSSNIPIDNVTSELIQFCNCGSEYRTANYRRLAKYMSASNISSLDRAKLAFCLFKFYEATGIEPDDRCLRLIRANEHFASLAGYP